MLFLQKVFLPAIARALKLRIRMLNYLTSLTHKTIKTDSTIKKELFLYGEQNFIFLVNLTKHLRLHALALRIQQDLIYNQVNSRLKELFGEEFVSLFERQQLKNK